jgi:diguanylate cyclase (GGDEF)-like protein
MSYAARNTAPDAPDVAPRMSFEPPIPITEGLLTERLRDSPTAPSWQKAALSRACANPSPRILVVDDELSNIDLLVDILSDDYEVLWATEGAAALEMAAIDRPDLILLDVMMPEMDGHEVCRRLKAERRTRDIPVIFITGLGRAAAETDGLELGAIDYIVKPIQPASVKARVKNQIKLKLTQNELIAQAATDGLTGLANRRRFDEMLAYEYARHARSGTELSLVLLDIDHFKSFNDTYGHLCGDDCLRQVAWAIKGAIVRGTDFVARYGGEEFVFLLPETNLRGAVMFAEKMQKCVAELAISHNAGEATGRVTASLGVISGKCHPGKPALHLVDQADEQLYFAKAGGRNRVAFPIVQPLH